MESEVVVWILCVLATIHSAQVLQLSLFPNETTFLDPISLFNAKHLDFTLNPPETTNARLIQSVNITKIAETEIEGNWHLGPTVSVHGELFFTTMTAASLQVWSCGQRVKKLWESKGPVYSLTPISIVGFAGYVFVESLQLCFLDLRLRPVSLQCFPGLEIQDSSRVIVCRECTKAAVVHLSPGLLTSQEYFLDYQTLSVSVGDLTTIDLEREEFLDGICTSNLFFLQTHGVYSVSENQIRLIEFPSAILNPTSLRAIPGSSAIYVVSENASAVLIYSQLLVLPEVTHVLSLTSQIVSVTANSSICIREVRDWRLSDCQVLPATVDSEYQWISELGFNLLLQKARKTLLLYLVEINPLCLALSGRGAPYTVDICGDSATCVAIAVETVAGTGEYIVVHSNSQSISLSEPLKASTMTFFLCLFEQFSGANLNSTLTFLQFPPEMSVSFTSLPYYHYGEIPKGLDRDDGEFLCGSMRQSRYQVAFKTENGVQVYATNDIERTVKCKLNNIMCAFGTESLYIYGEAEGRIWLYLFLNTRIFSKELEKIDDMLVTIMSTSAHAVLLFPFRLLIVNFANNESQTVKTDSRFIGLCEDKDTLILLTHSDVEFVVVVGGLYLSRAKVPISTGIRQCAYSYGVLMLLSGSDTVTVYSVTSSFQLIERYSLSAHCHVTHIVASEKFGAYRCASYYQVLDFSRSQHSSHYIRIPVIQEALFLAIEDSKLLEITAQERGFAARAWILHDILTHFVAVKIEKNPNLSEPISLIGVLNVTSNASIARQFTVNITLENHYAITYSPSHSLPNEIELPWGQKFSIDLSRHFNGSNLHFSATATDPTAKVDVQQMLTPLYNLPITALQNIVSVSLQHRLVFTYTTDSLVVSQYSCEKATCLIVRRHIYPVNFTIVHGINTIIDTDEYVYLFISGIKVSNSMKAEDALVLCSLSPHSMQFDILLYKKYSNNAKFHTIKVTDSYYHMFIYGDVLTHCTLHVGEYPPHSCTEVVHTSLYGIVALGSHQLSNAHWQVYALTYFHRLITMSLTDSVSVLADAAEFLTYGSESTMIIGQVIVSFIYQFALVYAIPTLQLSHRIFYINLGFHSRVESWTVDSFGHLLIASRDHQSSTVLIDITSGTIVTRVTNSLTTILSGSIAISYSNKTLTFLQLSPCVMTVEQGEASSSTEVEVVAGNEFSERRVKVRVVWVQEEYWVPAAIIGVLLCVSVLCRKTVQRFEEIEMRRITL